MNDGGLFGVAIYFFANCHFKNTMYSVTLVLLLFCSLSHKFTKRLSWILGTVVWLSLVSASTPSAPAVVRTQPSQVCTPLDERYHCVFDSLLHTLPAGVQPLTPFPFTSLIGTFVLQSSCPRSFSSYNSQVLLHHAGVTFAFAFSMQQDTNAPLSTNTSSEMS